MQVFPFPPLYIVRKKSCDKHNYNSRKISLDCEELFYIWLYVEIVWNKIPFLVCCIFVGTK